MNIEPFLNAGLVIQIHIISAVFALIIGALLFWRRKGTSRHKFYGKIWVGAMIMVALSSFFINEIRLLGPFSPIHILSIVTIASVIQIIRSARAGDIKSHEFTVKVLYFGGLLGAGLFTFLPGRIMHEMLFGKPEFYLTSISTAWILPVSVALIVTWYFYRRSRRIS